MTATVRVAGPDDALTVAEVHVASWRVAYRGLIPDDVLDSPDLLAARRAGWTRGLSEPTTPGRDPDERLLVVESDGRITGFAGFGWDRDAEDVEPPDRHGELYSCYLHPDAWGSGDADVLMAAAMEALARRFDRASLWVLRDNPRARRFYERWGWSCGDDVEVAMWDGPVMPDAPPLRAPIAEVRYRIDLASLLSSLDVRG